MPWERRQRGGVYYTRTRRIGGRRRRVYIGVGAVAEYAAAEDAVRRAERLAARVTLRADRARVAGAETAVRAFDDLVVSLARAALLAAGYRRHDRGQWRRTRPWLT